MSFMTGKTDPKYQKLIDGEYGQPIKTLITNGQMEASQRYSKLKPETLKIMKPETFERIYHREDVNFKKLIGILKEANHENLQF